MTDKETIEVYNNRAEEYAKCFTSDQPDAALQRFIKGVSKGGHVLDLGCGPATASAHMRSAGLTPDPVDASPEMVAHANAAYDINARVCMFDDIDVVDIYDGIWANFSLLHADRADLPRYLTALHTALKPGGFFHIGMKLGTGTARDKLGRFYTFVTEDELLGLLTHAGFTHSFTERGEGKGLSGTVEPWIIMNANG
jgi:SAM-dependent methyltransferase